MLILGLFSITWLFYLFSGFPQTQFILIIAASAYYFLWGNIYHLLEGDFHIKVMIEYLFIAILAVILLKGAILR